MKKTIVSVAASSTIFLASGAFAQGIPVIDAASIAQAVAMVGELQKQYTQMQQQFNQLNGARGMGALLAKPELRQYLPQEWKTVYNQVQMGGYGGISGAARAIKDANAVLTADDMNRMSQSSRTRIETQRTSAAVNQASAEEAYKQAGDRISYLNTLVQKIDQSVDPKDVMDLQAAIQAEQAMLQNEQIKLQLVAQLQAAEEKMQAQRQREEFMQTTRPHTARFGLKAN